MKKAAKKLDLLIRDARLQDVDRISQVMRDSIQHLGAGYYNKKQIDSICKFVCVPDQQLIVDGTYFVVENQAGDMLGCGGWSFRKTLYAGPKALLDQEDSLLNPAKDLARIRAMFVLPFCSGQGIGSLILNNSEQAAKDYGFKAGTLGATKSGRAFYTAKRWIEVKEEQAVLPDGVTIAVTQMEKIL